VGWRATRGEHAVRSSFANTIRPHAGTSLRIQGEVQTGSKAGQVGYNPVKDFVSHGSHMIPEAHHAGRAAQKRWWGASGVW